MAYGILVPQPGIEPLTLTLEVWSLNHWTARKVPRVVSFKGFFYFIVKKEQEGPS